MRSTSDVLAREQGRLALSFRRALLVAAAGASAAIACSSSGNPETTPVKITDEAGTSGDAEAGKPDAADKCAATKYEPTTANPAKSWAPTVSQVGTSSNQRAHQPGN